MQDLALEYRLRFEAQAPYRDRVWKILTRSFFQHYLRQDAAVLDLGSGWGEFIRNIKAERKYAMDLNPDAEARVGPGVQFLFQDASQEWGIPPDSLDLVFTSNFFEHLPTKETLRLTMLQAIKALKPGGRLICLGPNIRFLSDIYWDFWDHYLPLSDRTMSEGMALTGFQVERCLPRFLPYTMSQGFTPPPFFVSAYLRLPVLWPVIGKQFLIIGRKPE